MPLSLSARLRPQAPFCTQKGFSLAELAVVMAIGGILTAFAIPMVNASMTNVKKTQCVQRLHNLHLGIISYCSDHDGAFPYNGLNEVADDERWHRRIIPYMFSQARENDFRSVANQLYICPADKFPYQTVVSYGMNTRLAEKRLQTLSGGRLLLADAEDFMITAAETKVSTFRKDHHGEGNVIMTDGSCRQYRNLPAAATAPELWQP